MAKKNRIKAVVGETISRAEVEYIVGEIRQLRLTEQKVLTDKGKLIAQIEENCAEPLQQIAQAVKEKSALVQAWAEANPTEFGKRKSIEFTHGTVGFRTGTPKLALLSKKVTWADALAAVQRWLPNFIRSKPEIDKDAIIAQRAEIAWAIDECGMKVVQEEAFFVEPKIEQAEGSQRSAVRGQRSEGGRKAVARA